MEEIDLMQFLKLFWRKKIIIIITTIVGLIIGYIYNAFLTTPKYKATATFLLNGQGSSITTTEVTLNSKIVNNYVELIKSDVILDNVISTLNINMSKAELKKSIEVKVKNNAEYVDVSVALPEKENTMIISNKLVEVLKEKVKEIYNVDNVYITGYATIPEKPYNIKPGKYAVIGAVVGFIFACIIILIINMFDDTIKEDGDVENKTNLKVLATFRKQTNPNSFDWNPKLDYVEAFKSLRTNLQFSKEIDGTQTIAVSSTYPGEGKSWVVTNLAMAFAKAGYRVLIIDADLRKGVQHMKFKIDQRPGLYELIKSKDNAEEEVYWSKYVKETQIDNIFLLPSGRNTFDSAEVLLSKKLKKIINELKTGFDVLIFDSTPSALVTDATVLSRLVDTNIIVTEFEKTKFKELKSMKRSIESVGGDIAGVIINKVANKKNKKSYYYYGDERNLSGRKRSSKSRKR